MNHEVICNFVLVEGPAKGLLNVIHTRLGISEGNDATGEWTERMAQFYEAAGFLDARDEDFECDAAAISENIEIMRDEEKDITQLVVFSSCFKGNGWASLSRFQGHVIDGGGFWSDDVITERRIAYHRYINQKPVIA